jgi:hypothetical protein
MAAQLMATKGPSRRGPLSWAARANHSLPHAGLALDEQRNRLAQHAPGLVRRRTPARIARVQPRQRIARRLLRRLLLLLLLLLLLCNPFHYRGPDRAPVRHQLAEQRRAVMAPQRLGRIGLAVLA